MTIKISSWYIINDYIRGCKENKKELRKMIKYYAFAAFIILANMLSSQNHPLTYYLPDINYDSDITTPKEYLGHKLVIGILLTIN